MRKLLLVAVAGTAFALAGCSEKPATTEAAVESEAAMESAPAADASDASAPAADASAAASEAPKM